MILEHDEKLEALAETLSPGWTEIRADRRAFSKIDDASFMTGGVLLIGERSLLCCMTAKDFGDGVWEYYPIYLTEVEENKYAPEEWIRLVRKDGTANLDQMLGWVFETPSLSLTEDTESFTEPDGKETTFSFYNGLEIKDPNGRGSLRITSTGQPNFTVTLSVLPTP